MGSSLSHWICLFCFLATLASAVLDVQSRHPFFNFNQSPDIHYLIAPHPALTIPIVIHHIPANAVAGPIPATCIHMDDSRITKESLQSKISLYAKVDDVWTEDFLEALVLSYVGQGSATIDDRALSWLQSQGVKTLFLSGEIQHPVRPLFPTYQISGSTPPGPLVISLEAISSSALDFYNVYRLYVDEYDAFLFGAIPDSSNSGWIPTNITLFEEAVDYINAPQLIPVPSRLHMLSNPHLPLAGTRFGLKDIYDAQGLPTAAGSHAYSLTHPIPHMTAPSVEILLALGAVMVGKTRTSQFAHGAQPWEFMDVPYSWNPRGDGHLTASASSSGSACAIAGYSWLEFTVGSDTRGSVRKPAALVGAYGLRPSHGSMDLKGVVPLSEEMDTAGFFARHPRIFYEVASHWYADSPVASKRPTTKFPANLLYPIDHFPAKSPAAQKLFDDFVLALQHHLNITPIHINFTETLIPFLPNGSFPDFQMSSNELAEYRSWTSVGKPVTQEFMARFGMEPVFDPIPQKMFARAQSISDDDFATAVALKRAFADSVSQHIFQHDNESCSTSLFMYDAATGGLPSYRVEEFNHLSGAAPFLLTAAGSDGQAKSSDFFNFLASMGELPEVTVPIGQVDYFSHVSRKWEHLPIAVQLVTRKGCDGMLLNLVKKLAEVGVVGEVMVGRSLW